MKRIWTLPRDRVIPLPSRIIVAVAVGGLTVLTLPPFSILLLVPIAYATLLVLLRHLSVAKAALVGWAFGFGIDRMATLLHGVPDLRLLFDVGRMPHLR